MHEMGLLRDILKKSDSIRLQNNGKRVTKLQIWLGALSHITPDHFKEHFFQESKSTNAEGAELAIEVSTDQTHPQAMEIILKSIELED